MRARPSRAVSLLVTSMVLTGFLIPGVLAPPHGQESTSGSQAAADTGSVTVNAADLPAEPPAQPARPAAAELYGADCETLISGSQVLAYCHNGYPETDMLRLHVECDRWWDVDGDGAAVPLGPAGRTELTGRCWKEVRTAWVSHERP
ncbi:hypothetical protein ACIRP0_17580 [Streptomyces sp. NPDC101733]|uniref:hypothetical protein n=1 Tax=unclassified Streptomyces TaxID=2593676 RepID=UPI00382113B4